MPKRNVKSTDPDTQTLPKRKVASVVLEVVLNVLLLGLRGYLLRRFGPK
jgi:hypothetical protein